MTSERPPRSVATTGESNPDATRVVLVRHGEARCNVEGIVGGVRGDTGLSDVGRDQVAQLARRLEGSHELGPVDALYSSVLPRAIETATILAPSLDRADFARLLVPVEDCGLCELHPGEADGLGWSEFAARYPDPNWDVDPTVVLAPGGESWTGFVARASGAVAEIARRHEGDTVVLACHAGVIEASLLAFLPVSPTRPRLRLHTTHASLTIWERSNDQWLLVRYNDATALSTDERQQA